MRLDKSGLALASVGALLLNAAPASAQIEPNTHEVQVYAGELFGDDLTSTEISGNTPKLDDDVTYGVRYGYNFTGSWGLELSLGDTPTTVTHLTGGDLDLTLTTLDLDAVWHINPRGPGSFPISVAGVGYASADLDKRIQGTVNGTARLD